MRIEDLQTIRLLHFLISTILLISKESPSQGHIYHLRHQKFEKIDAKFEALKIIGAVTRPCDSNTLESMKEKYTFPLFTFHEKIKIKFVV